MIIFDERTLYLTMDLHDYRVQYNKARLTKADLANDPLDQFSAMFQFASAKGEIEPNAMTLSTYDEVHGLTARIVLLKEVSKKGFTFFTNYLSLKGQQLDVVPQSALTFWWRNIQAQVRITGNANKLTAAESDEYFHSRPLESQVSAAISKQSEVADSYVEIISAYERRLAAVTDNYVERPLHWGGYCVEPKTIEFWQGRPNRLHDRFRYTMTEEGWHLDRLYP